MNSLTNKCKTSPACKGYHHGDLRNALIVAADDLIREKGSLDFTMIDAARKAGVSSAAPYRHFKDKDALLQAGLSASDYVRGFRISSMHFCPSSFLPRRSSGATGRIPGWPNRAIG